MRFSDFRAPLQPGEYCWRNDKLWEFTFYDGMFDLEPDENVVRFEFVCPVCRNDKIKITFTDFYENSTWRMEDKGIQIIKFLELNNLCKIKNYSNEMIVCISNLGLSIHCIIIECEKCNAHFLVNIGFGEFQPARYIAQLQSVIQLT